MLEIWKKKLRFFNLVLASVFLAGFLIRIIGINPGFPPNHPDEPVIYATSAHLVVNNTFNPFTAPTYKFQYPGLTIYLYAFLFKFIFIPISWILRILSGQSTVLNDIVGPGFVNAIFWSRYITAFLSFLSVPLAYMVGKKMFNKYIGLISALFIAFNYRHVLASHFGLLDGPNSTFALLALYAALLVYEKQTLKNYLFAGVTIGLSLATKIHIFSVLPLIFVQFLLAISKHQLIFFVKTFFNRKFIFSSLIAVAVFVILNPYLIFYIPVAKHTMETYNLRIGLFYQPFEVTFPSLWYLYEIGFGKTMSILFLIGTFLLIKNRKQWINGIFLFSFIVFPGIILFYFSHGAAYVRYFASLTPFAAIISAFAFWILFEKVWQQLKLRKKYFFIILIFLALLAGFDQIKNSLTLDYYAIKPWNSECISNWMNKNIKKTDLVTINNLVPRVNAGVNYLEFDNTENHKNSYSLAELQNEKVDYAVGNIEYLRGRFNWWLSSGRLYWGMPITVFDNSFDGLALKELSRYTVATCTKPWQSPDNNFIAIKIPKLGEAKNLELIESRDFKSEAGKVWKLSNPLNSPVLEDARVVRSPDCISEYCFRLEGKSGINSWEKIIISESIPVKEGERYFVKAMVKPDREIKSGDRDGFLRIDFYNSSQADFSKRGVIASVSPRYFGDGSWEELNVSAVTPKNAKVMQVSFQVERYNKTFLIDQLNVYKALEKPAKEEIDASNRKEINNEVLYPLSLL